jgi:Legume lectin domain/Chitobiase/beta-hexosaminidase C-terminal domain
MKQIGSSRAGIAVVALVCLFSLALHAQVNIATYHNDNARTGQNIQETILTPANVNSGQFGKLFSVFVDGLVYAQPLYLSNVSIGGGTHNVLYVATEHDSLYAIDADEGTVYWQISLIPSGGSTVNSSSDLGCSDLVPEVGITGTPVIDTSTGTLYVVAKSKVGGSLVQYLHAIDVATAAEKFSGPVFIQATVPGTASDGNGTTVSFSPHLENQRAALLLVNGHVVIGWASHCDFSPWHGWIMSYSANSLSQEAAFNTSADGSANGVWMSGGGLAADSTGNIFFATGNGTWNGTTDYGDSIVKLGPPSGGKFPVLDYFTPYNQSSLAGGDTDVASGGLVLLPTLASNQQLLTQMGKEGKIYLIDRNNMGKYCVKDVPACNGNDPNIVEEIPGATAGVWGSPAYWNGSVYWGGASDGGGPDNLKAFSFNANNSGQISASPTSKSLKAFSFSAPSPSISANGNSNGILWGLDDSAFGSSCSGGSNCQVLYAYDATNLADMLYNSSQAANNRDVPGGAVKFATPIIANGKVYVGSQAAVSAYGAISTTPTAATPTFSPAPGTYTSTVNVALSDSNLGATIHCTSDGSTPIASSPTCSSVAISSTTTLKAIATASGNNPSNVASGTYTIDPGATGINFGSGFTSTGLTLNGTTKLNGTRLRLTDGGAHEAASAFISTPINVQTFTTDFGFQMSSASADGFTFTIQGAGATSLGPSGGGLGYGPDTPGGTPGIANSVSVKFDIYSNEGEGTDSTGLYTDGASPTTPALDMTSSGVSLLSGDVFNVHMTYNGTTLTMTITDATNSSQTFTASWPINIPSTVGSSTAYVGFTGGTGGLTAIQEVLDWTYVTSQPTAATPTFSPAPGTYTSPQSVTLLDTTSGAVIHCTTNGTTPTATSSACATLTVSTTSTIEAIAVASGYNNSAVASGTYNITAATPTFSPAPGTYTSPQSVMLSDTTSGAVIHCTTNGTTPTASSPACTTLTISTTSTIEAIAVASGYNNSAVASGTYTISTTGNSSVNYGSGFSSTGLALNGFAKLNGTRLRLTDGGSTEAGSGFYTTPLNMQSFTTDFSFQLTNPGADGLAFVIQDAGATALGPTGGGLGYGPDVPGGTPGIPSSVAVKFDLYDNAGEGTNSTGLYTGGASPTTPATTLGGNVNLHSGDVFNVHITYNGSTLAMTITDATTPADTFTTSWTVNIPSTVGGNTAYAGFTGGTGGSTATQDILNWTFTSGTSGGTIQYEATKIPVTGSPNARSFTWSGFPDGAGEIADGTAIGAYLNFTVNVATPGTYDVKAATKEFQGRGIFQLSINGVNAGPTEDEYNSNGNGVFQEFDLGTVKFATAGNYSFKFTVTGRNSHSSGYTVCLDYIKLTAQ